MAARGSDVSLFSPALTARFFVKQGGFAMSKKYTTMKKSSMANRCAQAAMAVLAVGLVLMLVLVAGCGASGGAGGGVGTGGNAGTGSEAGAGSSAGISSGGSGAGSGAGISSGGGGAGSGAGASGGGGGVGSGAGAATGAEATPVQPAADVQPATIRLGGLTGPTAMGMAKLLADADEGKTFNQYDFTLAGSADELTPKLIQGALDIAAVPANLAAILYNNTDGAIQLLAVNTLGVLYIVDTDAAGGISSFADLKGKTVYCTGKGSTPEYTLRYLLDKNGIDPDKDVTLEWKAEPAESVAILSQTGGVAMLPQPYVSVAQNTLPNLRIALDLTKEWDALDNGSMLITGVLVARRDFAEKYPDQIAVFLDEYKASTEYVNANVPEAAQMVDALGIIKAPIAEKAIPYCNITYLAGADMKQAAGGYLEALFAQNPRSIGGALPGDDFYYQ
jgi:NitT/TauT family transport system substrate-binding protein